MELKVQEVLQAPQVQLVVQAQLEVLDHKVLQALKELQDHKALLGKMEQKAQLVVPEDLVQ
jgi:hypothetical protein